MSYSPESEQCNDPIGSIFLSENKLIGDFLSLEGDPEELLSAIEEQSPDNVYRIYDTLKFSILQSRGVKPIDVMDDEEKIRDQIERRGQFYASLENALARLALAQTL